jgi:hypothetical protein
MKMYLTYISILMKTLSNSKYMQTKLSQLYRAHQLAENLLQVPDHLTFL